MPKEPSKPNNMPQKPNQSSPQQNGTSSSDQLTDKPVIIQPANVAQKMETPIKIQSPKIVSEDVKIEVRSSVIHENSKKD